VPSSQNLARDPMNDNKLVLWLYLKVQPKWPCPDPNINARFRTFLELIPLTFRYHFARTDIIIISLRPHTKLKACMRVRTHVRCTRRGPNRSRDTHVITAPCEARHYLRTLLCAVHFSKAMSNLWHWDHPEAIRCTSRVSRRTRC
jgi:hypothetical protein